MALVKIDKTKGKAVVNKKQQPQVRLGEKGTIAVQIKSTNSERARGVSLTVEQHRDLLSKEFQQDIHECARTGKSGKYAFITPKGIAYRLDGRTVPVSFTYEGWKEYFGLQSQIEELFDLAIDEQD